MFKRHVCLKMMWVICLPVLFQACGVADDEGSTGVEPDAFIRELWQSGVNARDFSRRLAEAGRSGSDVDLVRMLPSRSQQNLRGLTSALLVSGDERAATGHPGLVTAKSASPKRGPVGNAAAVVIIANGDSDIWRRNMAEYLGLTQFNLHLRDNYRNVVVCTGDSGTWDCFKNGITKVGPGASQIDLVVEGHGDNRNNDDGVSESYALDNSNVSGWASQVLRSDWAGKYRMGFFMPCYAGHGENSFARLFLKFGGRGAYAADQLSDYYSDIAIQAYMGSRGQPLGAAVDSANRWVNTMTNLGVWDFVSRVWNAPPQSIPSGAESTPKTAFGDRNLRIQAK